MTFTQQLPSRPVADPAAVVRGDHYRFTVLTDGLIRLEYAEDGIFEDRASAFALIRDLPVPEFRVIDTDQHLEIATDRMHLVYDRRPFSTSGLSIQILGNLSSYHSVWRFGEAGENLGGTARTLDWADGAIPLEPGVVSRLGFAVLDDSRTLLLQPGGWVEPRTGSRLDLYFFGYGRDYPQALQAFYAVSGPQPVVPRFALGNWWSRYHRYTADEYTNLIARFETEGIPFSVAVLDMDWHHVDVDPRYGSGWTGYSWNRELFPDPRAFLQSLHERGLKVTLNVHPADGVRAFEDSYAAMATALGRDPDVGDPIAFDVTDPEFFTAYFEVLHRALEDDGVDFWWLDWQSGPHSRVVGIDPLWMLNHYHFLDSAREGRRPLTFSRYAGPGSHRYPVGFSGDSLVTWASLDFQPYFTATASNIGYGWWSHDVGGHMMGSKDDELATRWVQLGAFSPILRLHSSSSPFNSKEPWRFGAEAQDVMTAFLRLRHRLIPYLHTMNHLAATEGTPLVRPMYWSHPEATDAYLVPNQFAFGSQLVVAPITTPIDSHSRLGATTAWLPPGTWVDILSGLVYDGDRKLLLHRDLSTMPVLAPAGAIVPLTADLAPGNDTGNPAALEVLVVVGADGTFELIEDDGTGTGLDPSVVVRTPITFDQDSGELTVGPATGALRALPERRTWRVGFVGPATGGAPVVTVDGTARDATVDVADGRTSVTLDDCAVTAVIRVSVGAAPTPAPNDVHGRLFTLLDRAYIGYQLKERVFEVATADVPVAVRMSHLQALDLDRSVETAVAEILLAR